MLTWSRRCQRPRLAAFVILLGIGLQVAAGSVRAEICRVTSSGSSSGDGSNWTAQAMDLQTALATGPCTELWVAAGTYVPTSGTDRSISFNIRPGLAVYGGFAGTETQRSQRDPAANVSTLSGDIGVAGDAADNSYHVLFMDGVNGGSPIVASTVVDGVTITAGNADSTDAASMDSKGGGLYCYGEGAGSECSPSLSQLVFRDNRAYLLGGALYNDGSHYGVSSPSLAHVGFNGNSVSTTHNGSNGGAMYDDAHDHGVSSPSLSDSAFTGNRARSNGGALYNNGETAGNGSPVLQRITFSGNSAYGGGAMASESYEGNCETLLIDVTFDGNIASRGGAMYNSTSYGSQSTTLKRVTFSNNSADDSGGALYNGSVNASLSNVTFSNNHSRYEGGAIYNSGFNGAGQLSLSNVSFNGNTLDNGSNATQGGAIYTYYGDIVASNVILWGDTATQGREIFSSGTVANSFDHSIIMGSGGSGSGWDGGLGTDGGGNLDLDPQLGALSDNGGLTQTQSPSISSPAIDAGNADTCANPPVDGVDQRGVARPLGTACDIGAVEVATSPKQISVAVSGLGSVSASQFPTPIRGRIADCTDSGGSQCSALYPQDFTLQLQASAAAHWHFSGWGGDCSGASSNISITSDIDRHCLAGFVIDSHILAGTLSGLAGSGLVLQDNAAENLALSANGGFEFDTPVEYGSAYDVSVASQPAQPAQTCQVINGAGIMGDSDVTDIAVSCITNRYSIGGSVSGLSGGSLVLQLNGGDDLTLAADGSFAFPTALQSGSYYSVSIASQPAGQICSIGQGSGMVSDADIVNVTASCADRSVQLQLHIDDSREYAHYGEMLDYLVTLDNSGSAAANGLAIAGVAGSAFDVAASGWICAAAGGASCTMHGSGLLSDSVTLPPGSSLTYVVTLPVRAGSIASVADFTISAGTSTATDTDTLVIFRDSFEGASGQAIQSPDGGITGKHVALVQIPSSSPRGVRTLRTWQQQAQVIHLDRLVLATRQYVRLRASTGSGTERASRWVAADPGAWLAIGRYDVGARHGALVEGAAEPLKIPLAKMQ